MRRKAGETIDFHKSNNFMRSWSPQTGEICHAGIALSMNQAPPPVRDRPAMEVVPRKTAEVPDRKKTKEDPYVNTFLAGMKAAEAVSGAVDGFKQWLNSPPPAPKEKTQPVRTVPPFDIQQIPEAMRKIGAPVGAALMDKWFAGELNYPPSSDDERDGLNQNGLPYPPSMIDTTSVKIEWVMKFARAQEGLEQLKSQLETPKARNAIADELRPYRNRTNIRPWLECKGDMVRLHKEFQFQRVFVEGSLSQKLTQYAAQELTNKGVPDDLTCALGSFALYAAISQADFSPAHNAATVTHISVYVKDSFTFTDESAHVSQYLGHWNRSHVAVVPIDQVAAMTNTWWLDLPLMQGNNIFAKDAVLYPVKNSDFRAWQRQHNQGGDFIIYTNKMFIELDEPIRVEL